MAKPKFKWRTPLVDRFWARVEKGEGAACWQWRGALHNGYGRLSFPEGGYVYVHRFSYELLVGSIPAGHQIDHLCRNRGCVRPDHLEAVTQAENLRRGDGWSGRAARATHCPQGHPYDANNTIVRKGHRYCRTCRDYKNRLRRKSA